MEELYLHSPICFLGIVLDYILYIKVNTSWRTLEMAENGRSYIHKLVICQ
jgi:hypothetical protein